MQHKADKSYTSPLKDICALIWWMEPYVDCWIVYVHMANTCKCKHTLTHKPSHHQSLQKQPAPLRAIRGDFAFLSEKGKQSQCPEAEMEY